MRVLYFDCFSGISGDMILGALLDLGVDHSKFLTELEKLNLDGYHLDIKKTTKSGISLTDVKVVLHETNSHSDKEHHHHGHNLFTIEALIDKSALNIRVKELSKEIFKELAKAEAKVHDCSINDIHFHEVGAVDSIVDVVGACILIDILGIECVYSSAVHDGNGYVKCQHGVMPVPVPAVAELLSESNIPISMEEIPTELVTPTGLAIIKNIASYFGIMPQMYIEKVGYGAGKKDTGRLNALRVFVGSMFEHDNPYNNVSVLETNIDNSSSEVVGYVFERLLEAGALDVYFTPIYMKKNRPGFMISVICPQNLEEKMVEILFKETNTLGIRRRESERYIAKRHFEGVETPFGNVKVKVSEMNEWARVSPEYEDVKEKALKNDVPFRVVYDSAIKSYNDPNKKGC